MRVVAVLLSILLVMLCVLLLGAVWYEAQLGGVGVSASIESLGEAVLASAKTASPIKIVRSNVTATLGIEERDPLVELSIPSIGLNHAVVERAESVLDGDGESTWDVPDAGVGWSAGHPEDPKSTVILYGHKDVWLRGVEQAIFSRLRETPAEAELVLKTASGKIYHYNATKRFKVQIAEPGRREMIRISPNPKLEEAWDQPPGSVIIYTCGGKWTSTGSAKGYYDSYTFVVFE